jgi:hypothetical protein
MKGTGVVLDKIVESGSAISVLFRVELTHALQARASGRDTIAMNSALSAIPATFSLSPEQQALLEDYTSYFSLLKSMMSDTLPGIQVDSIRMAMLNTLMEQTKEPVKTYARNILIANEAMTYSEPYLFPDELKSARVEKTRTMGKQKAKSCLEVYPNPALNYFIVEYNLNDKIGNSMNDAILEITTIQGKVVKLIVLTKKQDQVVLSLANYKPGMYVASLKYNGKLIESKKVTITNH